MKLIELLRICNNITVCVYINNSFIDCDSPDTLLHILNDDALYCDVSYIFGDMYNNAIDVYVKDNRRS